MARMNMTKAEREAFLAEVHVGVVGVPGEGAPMMVPVWYDYEPGGEIRFVTYAESKKMPGIRAAGRASMLVQTENAPYKYAWVEGPVRLGEPEAKRDVVGIAQRYLGEEGARQYLAATGGSEVRPGSVLVALKPEKWRTIDYGKMGRP